jgi:hypothetical protein
LDIDKDHQYSIYEAKVEYVNVSNASKLPFDVVSVSAVEHIHIELEIELIEVGTMTRNCPITQSIANTQKMKIVLVDLCNLINNTIFKVPHKYTKGDGPIKGSSTMSLRCLPGCPTPNTSTINPPIVTTLVTNQLIGKVEAVNQSILGEHAKNHQVESS